MGIYNVTHNVIQSKFHLLSLTELVQIIRHENLVILFIIDALPLFISIESKLL